jgi:beta-N-acetylhexosaminidase
MDEILRRIGQLFVLGFSGEVPSTEFLDFVGEEQVGGVILFEANCPTYATARESIRRISERLETPPFVAVDQEGGRVCRLRGAPAEFKSAAEYGRNNSIEHFREDYRRSVVAMTSLGFNLNLAPVADIHLNKKSACLDGRCFGYDPARVAEFVRVSVAVAHSQGMLCCLKHFPGLGAASIDPHEATATAAYDRMLWQQRERIPFAAGVEAGADFVMSTHMIITDDLSMKGSEMLGDYGRRAVAAFNAGHDLLMFCHDFEATLEAFEYFAGAVRSGEIDPERVNTALDRVSGVKLKLGRPVLR